MRRTHFVLMVVVLGLGCSSELGTILDKSPGATPTGTPTGSGTPTTPTPPPDPVVFVSSNVYRANDINTTIGGNAHCTTTAGAAGLGGTYAAWLSSPSADAIDRIDDVGPWHLYDGTMVFADKAAIATGPVAAITQDEAGNDLGNVEVWTGTLADGTAHGDDCTNWTTNGGQGHYGNAGATDGTWTNAMSDNCSVERHLYCFLNE